MSHVGHTPGPWTWDGEPHNIIVWCGPDKRVAFLMTSDGPTEANARLIAAAPDMLSALEQALGHIEVDETTHGRPFAAGNVIRAALAKAGAA